MKRMRWTERWPALLAVLAVTVCGPVRLRAEPLPPDPVEALRLYLRQDEKAARTPEVLAERKAILEKKAAAVLSLGDLARALTLQEWGGKGLDADLNDVWTSLGDRFERDVKEALTRGDPGLGRATARLLAELALAGRKGGIEMQRLQNRLPVFAGDVVELTKATDAGVSAAALRALGLINPDPERAVPALARVLDAARAGTSVGQRRAAAEALLNGIQTIADLCRKALGDEERRHALEQQIKLNGAAVLAAAKGAEDTDAVVRRLCLAAIQQAAHGLLDRIVIPPPDTLNFPPRDRTTWSEEERQRAQQYRHEVETELAELRPVVLALGKAGTVFPRALGDPEPAVVRTAAGAAEEVAGLRVKVRLLTATVPLIPATKEEGKKDEGKKDEDPLLQPLQAAVPALAKGLSAEDVRVRLACLYALETLEVEAAPAAEALVKALKDDNSYVRWGAARALGKMLPAGKGAITELAKLLTDPSGDVRVTAAAALEGYGPAAKEAVPPLGGAAVKGADADTQVWAMRALVAVGTEAQEAIPDLVRALSSKERKVREAAADALGKLGPAAKSTAKAAAIAALNKADDDEDAGVRLAAGRAVLEILKPARPK